MLLTQETGLLRPFAWFLGKILEGIFFLLEQIGIPNLGLAIIIFTLVVYLLMLPLTYKQQKFAKLQAKMNPEIEAIRKKYEGKQDQDSMMRMQQEQQLVYQKYGVNPMGSCLQAFIQIPLIWTLYRIIYNMPGYIPKIKQAFFPLVDKLYNLDSKGEFITDINNFTSAAGFKKLYNPAKTAFGVDAEYTKNVFINILNRANSTEWQSISDKFTDLASDVNNTLSKLSVYNSFLGLNITDSPSIILTTEWAKGADKNIGLIILVIMFPILSALTQWLNIKIMSVGRDMPKSNDGKESSIAQSMEMMNKFMPILSLTTVFVLPIGVGIYWICGAVIRTIIQIIVNKRIDKLDIDEVIKNNVEKMNEMRKKQGLPPQKISNNATITTRNIEEKKTNSQDRAAKIKESTDFYKNAGNAKEGSLASKAFMVKQYNEKNSKKGE